MFENIGDVFIYFLNKILGKSESVTCIDGSVLYSYIISFSMVLVSKTLGDNPDFVFGKIEIFYRGDDEKAMFLR